jgi:DNA-binding NarL/FixJ family response regulator
VWPPACGATLREAWAHPGPRQHDAPGRISLADPIAINVLIVDDDPLVRESLRTLLALDPNLHVVGEAANCAEALWQTQSQAPDVVLLDLELAADRGFALLGELRRRGLPVIALAVYPGGDADALAAGASCYLLKDAPRQALLAAVRAAYLRPRVQCPSPRVLEP